MRLNTMKFIQTLVLLLYFVIHNTCEEDTTYTNKYDGINIDEILSSERLLNGYINCLLDAGPCTPDGKELKKNLPDAMSNDCSKCTEKQREGADQVMHFIIEHRQADWVKLEKKYKSDGSYKMKYLKGKGENKEEPTETTTKD